MKAKALIHSFRLRTLPLSLSGVVWGTLLALSEGHFTWAVCLPLVFTTVSLQILSNLSNEYGDWHRGTDRDQAARLQFSLQSGALSEGEMRLAIVAFVVITILSGLTLLYTAFGYGIATIETPADLFSLRWLLGTKGWWFILLGALAIVAAVLYTLGKRPYGYHALGDLSVFLFFGLVSTLGSYYLFSNAFSAIILLPACALGCLITGVLHTNNIRDIDHDPLFGKRTVATLLGLRGARLYETILVATAYLFMALFNLLYAPVSPWAWLYLLSIPFALLHLKMIWTLKGATVDSAFKVLILTTVSFALLSVIPRLF